jgi:hypothetical protein
MSLFTIDNVLYTLLLDGELTSELSSSWGVLLFATLALAAYGVGWYILSQFVKRIDAEIVGKSRHFNWMYNAVRIFFFINAGIIALAILQMIFTSQYYVILSVAAMASGFTLQAVILGILGYRFLSWFRANRDLTIFLHGVTFATAALGSALIGFANAAIFLTVEPLQVAPISSSPATIEEIQKAQSFSSSQLYQILLIPFRLAFGLYWMATVLLLRSYTKSFGRLKFWTLVSLPLILFIMASALFNGGYYEHNVVFDVFTSLTAPLEASLFAAIFLVLANSTRKGTVGWGNRPLVFYLTVSGFGVMVLMATVSSPVHYIDFHQTPYPPFAVIPWSFGGFAAYMFSIGFYFSAISISQDRMLRKSIRRIATSETKLIGEIGMAQMHQEIERKVTLMTEEQEEILHKQTGIEQSLSEEEIKQYIDEALEETRRLQREQEE